MNSLSDDQLDSVSSKFDKFFPFTFRQNDMFYGKTIVTNSHEEFLVCFGKKKMGKSNVKCSTQRKKLTKKS